MKGKIESDLMPTEDPKRLMRSIKKIFPDADLRVEKNKIIGESDLEHFNELLANQRIRNTIHDELEKNKNQLDLSKLACEVGKISLDEDFPLGKVRLTIK